MTKKQMEEFHKLFEAEIEKAKLRCTIGGYRACAKSVIEMIDSGMTFEQIKNFCTEKEKECDIIEEVKLGVDNHGTK